MDKLKTSALGGFPFVLDDIRQFLGRLTSPGNHGIYQGFNNILRGYGDDFIVQGCILSGSTGAFSITEGWILLGGELIKVDTQGPFDEAVDGTFTKVTTFDPRGNKQFLNGSIADTYEKNRGVLNGLAGTLAFDADRFSELNIAETLDASSVVGTTRLKKKVIEIGDWNMDTTTVLNTVGHGLPSLVFKNIRTITVIIRNDADSLLFPLDGFDDALADNLRVNGGVLQLNNTNIILNRRTGGAFDSNLFDSTSFNRGWITIEFET